MSHERANLLEAFAAEVGSDGKVVALGGGTQLDVGTPVDADARVVRAPAGVVEHLPAEMTVRVRAGTAVADLDGALAEHGQCVAIPDWPGATVGGVLAVGRSGLRRLGWGPVRDAVLELRYVSAEGRVVKGGGPTVKNVSGYDLPRLLVGSLGTLGLIGEVVLRTRPRPPCERWFALDGVDPCALRLSLRQPAALLWNGITTWVLLDGHPADIDSEARASGLLGHDVEAPPELPPQRWSLDPREIAALPGDGSGPFVAEVGVGIVHREAPQPRRAMAEAVRDLHLRLKHAFDPTGRLAPGRTLW